MKYLSEIFGASHTVIIASSYGGCHIHIYIRNQKGWGIRSDHRYRTHLTYCLKQWSEYPHGIHLSGLPGRFGGLRSATPVMYCADDGRFNGTRLRFAKEHQTAIAE